MKRIEARFRIVTPMFISGADQTKAELRVPSIKGALRFWWRALNYEENPKILLEKESKIFGSSDQNIGQSKIKIKMIENNLKTLKIPKKWDVNDWKAYIGYGLSEPQDKKKKVFREYIESNQIFSISIGLMDSLKMNDISPTFEAFSLLGNLGSRSRKGWGSISIIDQNEEDIYIPVNREKYIEKIKSLKDRKTEKIPEYSAFSKNVLGKVGKPFDNGEKAFRDIGERFKEYLKSIKPQEREGFGIPRKGISTDRRSSPLLIHVHNIGSEYFWICLFLKSRFHEEYETPRKGWYPVENFIDRLEGVSI